jgi:hypothetical protein
VVGRPRTLFYRPIGIGPVFHGREGQPIVFRQTNLLALTAVMWKTRAEHIDWQKLLADKTCTLESG